MKKIFIALSFILIGFTATQGTFANSSILSETYNFQPGSISEDLGPNFIDMYDNYISVDSEKYYIQVIIDSTNDVDDITYKAEFYNVISNGFRIAENSSAPQLMFLITQYDSSPSTPIIYLYDNGNAYNFAATVTFELYENIVPIETSLIDLLGQFVTGFTGVLVSVTSGSQSIFYDDVEGQLTIIGVLLLIPFGLGLLVFGFKFVQNLFNQRHNRMENIKAAHSMGISPKRHKKNKK